MFDSGRFANYWWESGTPTFLRNLPKGEFAYDMQAVEGGATLFKSYTLANMDWRSLMSQTGYLTIQAYDEALGIYRLGFPNREVKDAMFQHLLGPFRHISQLDSRPLP